MAEKKFQWSVFTNNTRMEQYVVRTDEFPDFLEAIDLVRALLPETNPEHDGNGNGHVEEASAADFCEMHQKPMKRREAKNGGHYYDHRWQEKDGTGEAVWMVCNGKQVKAQGSNGK